MSQYFLLMFGSQRVPPNPNYSHTFATFVKVGWDGDGPCPKDARLRADTISWLPTKLKIRVNALRPEPGANLALSASLFVLTLIRQSASP